jgi:hypothetical protein
LIDRAIIHASLGLTWSPCPPCTALIGVGASLRFEIERNARSHSLDGWWGSSKLSSSWTLPCTTQEPQPRNSNGVPGHKILPSVLSSSKIDLCIPKEENTSKQYQLETFCPKFARSPTILQNLSLLRLCSSILSLRELRTTDVKPPND